MSAPRARILGVASYLPPAVRTSREVEELVVVSSPDVRFPTGMVETMTGVHTRHVADEGVDASDLAAAAARKLFTRLAYNPDDVDNLIFASASQDMLEPATANMVQEKAGTSGAVFDVKNACNSFLTGLDVASSLIAAGRARSVLVTTGELPSRSVKWSVVDREDLKLSFPGYTLGDAGAAALVVPAQGDRGIFHMDFQTVSRYWSAATIPGGGSAHPRGDEYSYFRSDGTTLRAAFEELGGGIIRRALAATHTTYADYSRILVHQVAMPFFRWFIDATGCPADRIEITVRSLGNIASATLPVGFCQAEERGAISPGDNVMWVGLASGISLGVMCMRY